MNFIENTGHTFTLKSYNQNPIGYEYENMPYIFWMDSDKTKRLSINNYYVRIINMMVPIQKEDLSGIGIEIECASNIYKLISTQHIQDAINTNISIDKIFCNKITLSKNDDLVQRLTDDDLIGVIVTDNNTQYAIVPIYVAGCSSIEGMLSTNILIHVFNKDNTNKVCDESWTPVTVGGEWVDENEILYINAENMGISLPKDILHAVYQNSFISDEFNVELYNLKLKEYMLNYMQIRAEAGNFNSAISSLKWFGYGDKITISKLLKTDNEFQRQYVRDYFDISNDILESYSTFRNSTMISLSLKENDETGSNHKFDFNSQFFGEGQPEMKSLFDTYERVQVGKDNASDDYSDEAMYFMKPYYDYCFYELGLKLSALKYYYDRYFLPIHLIINSLAIEHKVYANDIKFAVQAKESFVEHIVDLSHTSDSQYNDIEILCDEIQYLTHQVHYVDSHYIEYNDMYDDDKHVYYYINDTCTNIPIRFNTNGKYYNCVLMLAKRDTNELVYETHFSVYQQDDKSTVKSFVIYPQQIHKMHNTQYFADSDFILYMCVNNRWISRSFTIKMPELNVEFGKLKYNYYDDENNIFTSFNQLSSINDNSIEFNSFMYAPRLVTSNHVSFIDDLVHYYNTNNIQYIDGSMIDRSGFYRYIVYDNVKVYIHDSVFSHALTIFNKSLQDTENMMIFIKDDTQYILKKRPDNDVYEMISFFNGNALDDRYEFDYYEENDIKHILTYNELTNEYMEDTTGYEIKYTNVVSNEFMDKYETVSNIAISDKYLNSMHVFNIYRKQDTVIPEEQFKLYNNYELKFDGITFYRPNNSSYINIIGHYDESSADIREYDSQYTDTRDYHADLYNEWDTKLTKHTKSFGYYLNADNEPTTQILSYTIESNPIDGYILYDSLNDMKMDRRSTIERDTISSNIMSHKNSDGYVEYFYNDNGDILNFYAKYWYYDYGWIKDYNPLQYDIVQFINALQANDNHYKIELHFINVRKKYSKHLNKYVHVDNNDVVELNGKYYLRDNNDIELVATDEIKYYDNDTKRYISTKYPTMHWNVSNDERDDVNMFWNANAGDSRYTYNIDINTYDSSPYWPDDTYSLKNNYCQYITGLDGQVSISVEPYSNQASNISSISIVACVNDTSSYIATGSNAVEFDVHENDVICAYLQVDTSIEYNDYVIPHVTFNRHTMRDEQLRYDEIETFDSGQVISIGSYKYEDNTSQHVVDLYRDFFYKTPLFMKFYGMPMYTVNENTELDLGLGMKYDFYLMHDMTYWYGVYISRDTIDKVIDIHDITVKDKNMLVNGIKSQMQYVLKHVKSSTQFLINRMKYISSQGKNHFKCDDIITANLLNNSRLPVNLNISAKWHIKPLSIGISNASTMTSNTEMAILDIPKNDSKYKRGYYDVSVRYSVDENTQQQHIKRARIRID